MPTRHAPPGPRATASASAPTEPLPVVRARTAPAAAEEPPSDEPHPVRRAAGAVLGLVVVLSVLAAAAVALVPAVTGARALTVLTGSMEPALPVGSVVVVRPTPPEAIRPGDVLTYTDRDADTGASRTVTHRVVEVRTEPSGPVFVTKGDANDAVDIRDTVAADVIGVQWYAVPVVGYAREFVASTSGLLTLAGLGLALLAGHLLLPRTRPARARRR